MQAQLAPQLTGFLERDRADQIERQRCADQCGNNIAGELLFEPLDIVFDGHLKTLILSACGDKFQTIDCYRQSRSSQIYGSM
jgi:hypothetical protein